MQSKISTFFKSSSSFAAIESPEPPPITGEEDELDVWEKKQHQFWNTYSRRSRNPSSVEKDKTENSQLVKKTVLNDHFSKPESSILGRPVVKNKKRSYAQFHLELGQSDFLLHTCTKCGVKYTPGAKEDEKAHKAFHKDFTHGIQFKAWSNERVVHMPTMESGRIVMVLDSDSLVHKNKVGEVVKMMEVELGSGWIFHKLCKVFLFILSQRVAGCLVAEPIEKAFKVLSISTEKSTDATNTKEETDRPTTLQFGDFSFQREVVKKAPSDINTKHSDKDLRGTILCEKEAVPAVCGIRAIWVSPANRRKHIATYLLDAVRKSFCLGVVLERSQLAFSQPTLAGKALASNYIGAGSFLVYKSNNLSSADS
ncbi:hypothetical protein L484_002227 [Morus notabilis]|uniref:N-acetyltransferase ESCO2 n=2 Tax=Morus notabilis TaxID=981085 RepID=W9SC91_9ROSA|nr:hypothetical protein L484_002227 [Morus notabilis]